LATLNRLHSRTERGGCVWRGGRLGAQALEAQKAATEEMRVQLTAVKQEIVKLDSLRDVLDTQRSSLATQAAAAGASHAQLRSTVDDVHARLATLEAAAVPAKPETTKPSSRNELQSVVGTVDDVSSRVARLEAAAEAKAATVAKQAANGVSREELQVVVGDVNGTVAAVTERVAALEAAPAAWWASRDAVAAEMKDVRGALKAGQADTSARCERETRRAQRQSAGGGRRKLVRSNKLQVLAG
jgi:chromosome segregation ATPase